MPPTLKRRRLADLDPFIENCIVNYGQDGGKRKAKVQVVSVCDITDSVRIESTDVCMLLVSDGTTVIPAMLSEATEENMQDLESHAALCHAVLFLHDFSLEFDMHLDLASCQFYLRINRFDIHCLTANRLDVPICTSLSSVREQAIKTWRLLNESSSESFLCSSSGVSLSAVLNAWHDDVIINILNDAMEKITESAAHCPGVAAATHWHRERLQRRGQEQFTVPVSHLLLPEEPRMLMTSDPGRNLNGLAEEPESDASIPDLTVDLLDSHTVSGLDEGSVTVVQGMPGDLSGESLCDVFPPVQDLLDTRFTSDPSDPNLDSQMESQSLLRSVYPLPGVSIPNQAHCSKISEDAITLGQRSQPSQISPSHTCSGYVGEPSQDRASSPPTWIVETTASPAHPRPPTASSQAPTSELDISSTSPSGQPHNVHSDGKAFSYSYQPRPRVSAALSHYKVPGRLLQWAVRYLGSPERADVNIDAAS